MKIQISKTLTGALCAGLISLGLASTAQASLIARLGGAAVYDTDLDITLAGGRECRRRFVVRQWGFRRPTVG